MQFYWFLLFIAFGVTFTVASSTIFEPVRKWFTSTKNDSTNLFFENLFGCYFCCGFHSSWFVALVSLAYAPQETVLFDVSFIVGFGFVGATFCYILDKVIAILEKHGE